MTPQEHCWIYKTGSHPRRRPPERAGLPSLKEVAAKAVALETWKGFYSNDGGSGARNPVGDFVFHIPRRP
ncbi:Hypothetical protein FKW44_015153 [Caligus rogercresseyi]|uniref:Uncharacterized protein n=1 Tax=Caligus rogercresseyi TaxID=217165 RepID=A0A7T8GZZ9_CALRO|nr:Hypothetical protein FKW44_015153 [Caligus rogercresseyi]